MSRYLLFGVLMAFLLISTYITNAFTVYLDDDTFGIENPIGQVDASGDTDTERVLSLVDTFFAALTFNITGLPAIVSIILFGVPTLIIAFMTLELGIKIVEAIIPF